MEHVRAIFFYGALRAALCFWFFSWLLARLLGVFRLASVSLWSVFVGVVWMWLPWWQLKGWRLFLETLLGSSHGSVVKFLADLSVVLLGVWSLSVAIYAVWWGFRRVLGGHLGWGGSVRVVGGAAAFFSFYFPVYFGGVGLSRVPPLGEGRSPFFLASTQRGEPPESAGGGKDAFAESPLKSGTLFPDEVQGGIVAHLKEEAARGKLSGWGDMGRWTPYIYEEPRMVAGRRQWKEKWVLELGGVKRGEVLLEGFEGGEGWGVMQYRMVPTPNSSVL